MTRSLLGKKSACQLIVAALVACCGSATACAATQGSSKSTASTSAHKRSTHKATPSAGTPSTSTAKASASKASATKTISHKSPRKRSRTKKVKGQQAPTADRISQIQEALAGKNVFTGTPTGVWDDSTSAAVRKFQSSNGLTPTGKLDALTLQKLGLGSETAGVAPPIVPPDAENRLRSSSTPAPSSAEPR